MCENNLPDSSVNKLINYSRTVYPGEIFKVCVVAVGQKDGTVSSRVISIIGQENPGHLPDSQHLQQANNICTKLNYTVLSLSQYVDIGLYPDGSPCSVVFDTSIYILVSLNQTCLPGFNLSES